jgi:hypothetical protein
MLSKHTDFDADLEDLAHRVIGRCLAVLGNSEPVLLRLPMRGC